MIRFYEANNVISDCNEKEAEAKEVKDSEDLEKYSYVETLVNTSDVKQEGIKDIRDEIEEGIQENQEEIEEKRYDYDETRKPEGYGSVKGESIENNNFEENFNEKQVCDFADKTIFDVNDMDKITNCKVVKGDVVIDGIQEPFVDIGEINEIQGNFVIKNSPGVIKLIGNNLRKIKNSFILLEMTSLTHIIFPELYDMLKLEWKVLPILSNIKIKENVENLDSILISDTSLTKFVNFSSGELNYLNINNNRFLEFINSNVEKIKGKLEILANGENLKVIFPNLKEAYNLTLQKASSLEMGSLKKILNSAMFIDNEFERLTIPELDHIGDSLNFENNKKLTDVDLSELQTIGGSLLINGNDKFKNIEFSPKLTTIGGAINLSGPPNKLSFPKLKLVKGSVKINVTNKNFDCDHWLNESSKKIIKGKKIECSNGEQKTQKFLEKDSDPDKHYYTSDSALKKIFFCDISAENKKKIIYLSFASFFFVFLF